jgi:hypothetical protein
MRFDLSSLGRQGNNNESAPARRKTFFNRSPINFCSNRQEARERFLTMLMASVMIVRFGYLAWELSS